MNAVIAPMSPDSRMTMTSREIAELTGKQHAHVMRDIRLMLVELHGEGGVSRFGDTPFNPELVGERGVLKFQDTYLNPQNGQTYPIFSLPWNETTCLMTGYDAKARMAVIKRWKELEEAPKPAPDLADPATLRAMLLGYTEKVVALEDKVKTQAPKVQAFDRIATSDGALNLQTAGKVLQQPPNKFIQWLREKHYIFKRPGSSNNCAHVEKINAGYLTTKSYTIEMPDGSTKIRDQVLITPKGLAKIALILGVEVDGDPFGAVGG